jgi:hypothetical protein
LINITYQRGRYEVKGDSWNVEAGEGYKPASVNLVQQTMRMAKALRAFIERQGTKVPVEIEPVLIAADPGIHIETTRPAVRVLMIDGIKSFVSNLVLGQPVMSSEYVYELTERIVNPRPARRPGTAPASTPAVEPREPWESPAQEVSRARAIFDASQETRPFDPADFDFAMDEEPNFEIAPPPTSVVESSPAQPLPQPKPRSTRRLGMTSGQLAILAVLALVFLCIVAGFGYYLFVLT